MSSNETKNYHGNIDKVVRNYVLKEGFSEFKISYKDVSKSYSSTAKLITVQGIINGRLQEEHLFAKTLTNSQARNDRLNLDMKFQREVFIYESVLNSFEDLQKVLKNENKVPLTKCIQANNECIILENLKNLGFKDLSDEKYMDLEHMTLMMKELGKFHGLSFVFKHRDCETFKKISQKLNDIFFPVSRRRQLVESTWNYALSALKSDEIKLKVLKNLKVFDEALIGCDVPENGVICHGDFNIRNVLFKYNQENKPISMIMIDYQQSFFGSPVRDVLFTMGSSISNELRTSHFEYLMQTYYNSLRDFLQLFKMDLSNHFSEDNFIDDLKKYFPDALANNLVTLRVICSPRRSEEDMDEMYNRPQGTGSIFVYNSKEAEDDYSERINGLMNHYIDINYI